MPSVHRIQQILAELPSQGGIRCSKFLVFVSRFHFLRFVAQLGKASLEFRNRPQQLFRQFSAREESVRRFRGSANFLGASPSRSAELVAPQHPQFPNHGSATSIARSLSGLRANNSYTLTVFTLFWAVAHIQVGAQIAGTGQRSNNWSSPIYRQG